MTIFGARGSVVAEQMAAVWASAGVAEPLPDHQLVGPTLRFPSAYDVVAAAAVPVGVAALAAASLARRRGLEVVPPTMATDHALASCAGHVRREGERPAAWAPLSGRYRTADNRFVQIHANFAHHGAGVAAHLGVNEDRDAVAAAIAERAGAELEAELTAEGMICALYRTPPEWTAHPHAVATAALPLLDIERIGDGAPLDRTRARQRALDGIRVLDCTRVLAGPVCGQTLAAHGADVLRIGAGHLPSIEMGVLSTGFGKRNAFVDLRTTDGRDVFSRLLEQADVVIDAYRPGALAGHGFSATEIARRRPGVVTVELSAFDWTGPWAGRRGFDSIVQSTTGIAAAGGTAAGNAEPVHLPFQALDYATGYLAAFAAIRLLDQQHQVGGSWRARLSLLRTRNWLAGLGGPEPFQPADSPDLSRWTHTVDSPFGRIEAIRPVAGWWDRPPTPLGSADPAWLDR